MVQELELRRSQLNPAVAPHPPFKALIFDCDGTLANTLPLHYRTWSATFASHRAELTREWYYQHSGISARELVQLFNQTFGYDFDPVTLSRTKQQQFRDLISTVTEIPAVVEVVRTYHGHIPMAVASGSERLVMETTLTTLNLKHLFDEIVCINDVTKGKPEPDLFLMAAQRLGFDPSDCIVYEDSDNGFEAAQRAGMRFINVRAVW